MHVKVGLPRLRPTPWIVYRFFFFSAGEGSRSRAARLLNYDQRRLLKPNRPWWPQSSDRLIIVDAPGLTRTYTGPPELLRNRHLPYCQAHQDEAYAGCEDFRSYAPINAESSAGGLKCGPVSLGRQTRQAPESENVPDPESSTHASSDSAGGVPCE